MDCQLRAPLGGRRLPGAPLQIKFGPSAWFAINEDLNWRNSDDPQLADYSRLFLTRSSRGEIRQSSVTVQEVLDGLDPTDNRLRDELLRLMG